MPKKLLILSQNAWRDDNSFGSTYSNIFKHIKNVQIANIYCESAKPKNNIVKKHFQISESLLIKNLINKNSDSGIEVFKTNNQDLKAETSTKAVRQAKKLRWQIFFWGRDLIWKIGRWKSKELLKFIDDFDADVLFFPLYVANHMNDIAYFIKKHTKKKLIFYVSDDVYTLKQFSLSPFYWINRFIARAKIKRVMKLCDLLYVISVVQKRDYEKIFNVPCKVLTKGDKFIGKPPIKKSIETPIKMVFTGNIGSGRWKMLGLVADALKRINIKGELAKLDIYTLTLLTEKMINALNIEKSSSICGGVSAKQVKKIQADADILVHVE